jgi:hypothetical protein
MTGVACCQSIDQVSGNASNDGAGIHALPRVRGHPYPGSCNDGTTMTSSQWLRDELARLRIFKQKTCLESDEPEAGSVLDAVGSVWRLAGLTSEDSARPRGLIRCIQHGGVLKATLACRQTMTGTDPAAGICELSVRLQSLEQGIPCLRCAKTGSSVRQRTDEHPRLSHIINAGMAMVVVINGSRCAGG